MPVDVQVSDQIDSLRDHHLPNRTHDMPAEIYNTNPTVFATKASRSNHHNVHSLWIDDQVSSLEDGSNDDEPIDSDEIFGAHSLDRDMGDTDIGSSDHIRFITDPEHPLTLEQLAVVSAPQVEVKGNHVMVEFTPTVPHCGASTLIGEFFKFSKLFSID